MAKSERQHQKKADAKKRRERKRKAEQAKRAQLHETFADFRRKAPMIKQLLKQRGYEQKFYDFLDSYVEAFKREAAQAENDFPSLLGVHEVEDEEYYATDQSPLFARLGHSGLTQVFFIGTDVDEDYLARDRKSNINGTTIALRDEANQLKTLVLIRKRVANVSNTDIKCAFKLIALFHELGHVKDWEQGIHLKEGDVAILDAEVYAHEYALHKLMQGDYRAALNTYLPAFEGLQRETDYRKVVADRVVGSDIFVQCEECAKMNWSDHLDADDPSAAKLDALLPSILDKAFKGEL